MLGFLETYHEAILVVHVAAMALGLGSATITDLFFFKFLKDFRISRWEAGVLRTLSPFIWFALSLLLVTGIGLYIPEAETLRQSPKFLTKLVVVSIIIINGAFLNLFVAPKLTKIAFHEPHRHRIGELHLFRKLAFALGAISITSWYSAFLLGMIRVTPLDFATLLTGYGVLLAIAVSGSQAIEHLFSKKQ